MGGGVGGQMDEWVVLGGSRAWLETPGLYPGRTSFWASFPAFLRITPTSPFVEVVKTAFLAVWSGASEASAVGSRCCLEQKRTLQSDLGRARRN